MSLEKLIKPNSVAIVGVSEKPGKFGHSAALNIRKSNLTEVYFVHPKRGEVFGQKCYKNLSDLPAIVDCAVLCTPGYTVNAILHEAGELGIPTAVVFASGFSEESSTRAREMEEELVAIAAQYNMQVLGPNCLGVYNAVDDIYLWGMDSPHIPTENITGIGVAAQSGWVVERPPSG